MKTKLTPAEKNARRIDAILSKLRAKDIIKANVAAAKKAKA